MTAAAASAALIDELTTLAVKLADIARPIVLKQFRSAVKHEAKDDASPVTEVDRAAETAMRKLIGKARPQDGIFGEEFGVKNQDAETVWILDPIDGTKAFITGKPIFGILIGAVHKGQAVVGIVDGPATGDRWIGAAGQPTTFNGKYAFTRKGRKLKDAWLTTTSPKMFSPRNLTRFNRLSKACHYTVYGSECQGYGQLACGWVDLVCEDTLAPYDYAALVPVIDGAGGIITDWKGKPLDFSSAGDAKSRNVLAAADAALLAKAVAILNR
ncbi:MAG: histidinol phosphate phosphatase [Proteobacteria bacterium]|nr:histidinol phosphate phosphatase [Pseudomonadota bacterium]